jgi:hypothetical protein
MTTRRCPDFRSPQRCAAIDLPSCALFAAIALFVPLFVASIHAYPGGTAWNPASRGHDFWHNYLCDLTRATALDGTPNPVGSKLARSAMSVIALGFAPFWWLLPRLFPRRRRLGWTVRALGAVSVAGAIAVSNLPSDHFAGIHSYAIAIGGVPGFAAAVLSVVALALDERAPRVTAWFGALALAVGAVDYTLYVRQGWLPGPGPIAIAILERVALLLVLAWMAVVAVHARRVR